MPIFDKALNNMLEGRDVFARLVIDNFFRSRFVEKVSRLSKEELEMRIKRLETETIPEKESEMSRWTTGKKVLTLVYGTSPVLEEKYVLDLYKEAYEKK